MVAINFSCNFFVGHPDAEVDIAIMNVSSGLVGLFNQGNKPFYSQTTNDIIPTTEIIEKAINSVEEIVFVGYPNGIWDSVNNLPIVRKGITATPFNIDFMGQPQFLIDASVFPGSSGSPVFAYRNGAFTERDGSLKYGDKLYLLGIVAKVYQRIEEGQIVIKDIPTSHVPFAQVKQMIDLGIVFKATTILETIAHYLQINQSKN